MSKQTHQESEAHTIRKLADENAALRERVAELELALNTVFTLASDAEAVEAVCVQSLARKGYDHYTASGAEEADVIEMDDTLRSLGVASAMSCDKQWECKLTDTEFAELCNDIRRWRSQLLSLTAEIERLREQVSARSVSAPTFLLPGDDPSDEFAIEWHSDDGSDVTVLYLDVKAARMIEWKGGKLVARKRWPDNASLDR